MAINKTASKKLNRNVRLISLERDFAAEFSQMSVFWPLERHPALDMAVTFTADISKTQLTTK